MSIISKEENKEIGARFNKPRIRKGWSEPELADLLGKSTLQIRRYLSGESLISFVSGVRLYQSGIDIGYIITGIPSYLFSINTACSTMPLEMLKE